MCSILICIASFMMHAQSVLPSATAGAFGKYVDQPVSHFTGTSNVTIPVATVSDGPLSHKISLDYHTGGIRVADIPTEVGLGWNLTGGGMITRTIRGIPDDINNGGYWNNGDELNTGSTHVNQVANQNRDGEPDLFTYSFGSYQGKFLFDKNHDIMMLPKNDIKIQPYFSLYTDFKGFIVTTPDGTKYYFGDTNQDWQNSWDVNEEFQEIEGDWSHDISWRLVRIESFDKKHFIDFDYRRNYYKYKVWSDCSIYSAYYNGSQNFIGDCEIEELDVYMRASTLSKITTPTTEVTFFYSTRQDLYDHPNFTDDPIRLNRIEVDEGSYCYKMQLTQSYFQDGSSSDPGTKRLKLDQVRKQPCSGTPSDFNSEQPWKFTYHGGSFFPKYLSKRIDHWGYYNGASGNDNDDHLIPYSCYSNQCYGQAFRGTVESQMLKGSLQTVTYPTKGKLTFSYEANTYKDDNSSSIPLGSLQTCSSANGCCGTQSDEMTLTLDQSMINSGKYTLGILTYPPLGGCTNTFMQVSLSIQDMTTGGNTVHNKSMNTSQAGYTNSLTINLNTISNLVAGHSYKFKVNSYFAKGTLSLSYNPTYINRLCGGLRINQTKLHDGISSSRDIIRNFNYDEFNTGFSSGILNAEPKYAYRAYSANLITTVIFNSNSIKPLSSLDGYHIGYENVTVDQNGNGQEKYTFVEEYTPIASTSYPAAPPIAKVYQGNLKQSQILNEAGTLESQKVITRKYNDYYSTAPGTVYKAAKVRARITANSGWTWRYVHKTYQNKTSIYRPSKIVNLLDGVSETEDIYYESPTVYDRTRSTMTNSDGLVTEVKTYYTGDYETSLKNVFVDRNMIGIPYKTEKFVDGVHVDGNKTVFSNFRDDGVRTTSLSLSYFPRPYINQRWERTWVNGILQSGSWVDKSKLFRYRSNGLLYYMQDIGWSYRYFYYNSDKLITQTLYSSFREYFNYHSGTRLLSSKTNIDGTTENYTYDALTRLKTARDNCTNITTTYNYFMPLYISSAKPYIEKIVDHPTASNSAVNDLKSRTYFDGLGREIQKVQYRRSRYNKDFLYSKEYDNQGRIKNEYKIRQSPYNDFSYVPPSSSWLKTESHYYDSPLNRVEWTLPPSWYKTYYYYGNNDSNDYVRKNGSSSNYAVGSLYKLTVKDPENNKSITFKDRKGRAILSRRTNDAENSKLDSYNVYDNKDRITHVLPPGAYDKTSTYQNLFYRYEYDREDRITSKWTPGAQVVYYKYNTKDLVGAYQDGKMRAQNKWYTYIYDTYGREIMQGHFSGTPTATSQPTELLIKTTFGTASYNKDKVTKVETKVLGTNTWITQNNTFNSCGTLTSNNSNNHVNTTANSINSTFAYDGAFNVTKTTTNINAYSNNKQIINTQTYDHAGRARLNYFKVDNGINTLIANNYYNNEDELYLTYQGRSGSRYLQAIHYTYNALGRLSRMNSSALQGSEQAWNVCSDPPMSDPGTSYANKDLFYLELFYNSAIPGVSTTIRKDGNIAGMQWQVKGRAQGIYRNTYDNFSRLKSSAYYERNDGAIDNTATGRYSTSYNYDVRGNLTKIYRNGMTDANGCASFGQIDNLTLSYNSRTNQLRNVTDYAPSSFRAKGFKNTNSSNYSYDQNGNLTRHQDKRIDIIYNHLNLPTLIDFLDNNQRVEFVYDASGNLLQRQVKNGSTVIEKKDWIGGIEYIDGTIESVQHPQGRVFYTNGSSPRYEYSITDHLGNVRLQYADLNNNQKIESASEIIWEGHYYPFGMAMQGAWMDHPGSESQYQFNGIERLKAFNLNLDFTMNRILDPSIGRWYQIDPFANHLAAHSPYHSMMNNPLLYSDPNGDLPPLLFVGAAILGAGQNVYSNWDKIVKNPWSAIGYGLTGAAGGAVSVVNPAAGRAIAAGGNIITDAATGNLPDFSSFGDVAGYAAGTTLDAISVGGSGKIAAMGWKGLKGLGKEAGEDLLGEILSGELLDELGYKYARDELGNVIRDEAIDALITQVTGQVTITAAAPNLVGNSIGSAASTTISGNMAIHANSANSTRPTQVYHHTFTDGNGNFKTYTGVGDANGKRAWKSMNRIESKNPGWTYYDSKFTTTANRANAYKVEQLMIKSNGGAGNKLKNFNKINSPGKKLLRKIF